MKADEKRQLVEKCKTAALAMRKNIVQMTYRSGSIGAHIGGSLSMVEIMAVLYLAVLRYDLSNTLNDKRDRFILSKGHGAMTLYAALHQVGVLSDEELEGFKSNDTILGAHPSMNREKLIEFSSGSLGQGLSLGVGVCLGLERSKNYDSKVYVLLGDGECNEGSVWEAAMAASHYRLNHLVAIIDQNHLQYDGTTAEVMDMGSAESKWKSFGWDVITADGHSIEDLYDAFRTEHERPLAIIANTIKGKGISFMENNALWHNNRLSEKQYEQALAELEAFA